MRTLAFAAVLMLVSTATLAADNDWSGTGELGLAIAKGNADNQTLNAKLNLARESGAWKHSAGATFLYGKSSGLESARRYEAYAGTGYRMRERHHLFGSVRNERDHFAASEYQWAASGGYGYEAIKSDTTQLTLEVGAGYRWAKLQDQRRHLDQAIGRGYMNFDHKFNANTSVRDTFLVEYGSDNTFARNDFGVLVKMSEALALKAALEVRHNTDVPLGVKNTDTLSTLNLVYGF